MIKSHQTFIINSANRISGDDSSFTINLDIDLTAKFDHCIILRASIPKSYYLIQDGFNTFTLRENLTDVTVTIPPGNYSYLSFMATLPPLLNAASPNGWTYSMSYPNRLTEPDTGKFTYSVTGNTSQPSFITTDNVNEQLGFETNTTHTFTNDQLISTTVINFTQEPTLFIHSDLADNVTNDILQDIYDSNTPPMSYINYELTSEIMSAAKPIRTTNTNTVRFSLTNENARVMNLNGRNQVFTLMCLRKDNINDVIRSYIGARLTRQF